MSGSTIGGVVGAVIGFYVGGPQGAQWGWMIGSAVGGYVDPEHVKGVQLGDLSPQPSVSGMPIPIVFGTSVAKGCRVISQSDIRVRVEEEQAGKGAGPVVENEVAYQDFTIEVCESSELRGTSVQGILVVWQDGQIVYDARPNPLVSYADSSKWKKDVTFYYGGEDQEPDPTEESYLGIGQVPAYRGKCRMVFANRNISKFGNRIPQYECLVSSCPVEEIEAAQWLITFAADGSGNAMKKSPNGIDWTPGAYQPGNWFPGDARFARNGADEVLCVTGQASSGAQAIHSLDGGLTWTASSPPNLSAGGNEVVQIGGYWNIAGNNFDGPKRAACGAPPVWSEQPGMPHAYQGIGTLGHRLILVSSGSGGSAGVQVSEDYGDTFASAGSLGQTENITVGGLAEGPSVIGLVGTTGGAGNWDCVVLSSGSGLSGSWVAQPNPFPTSTEVLGDRGVIHHDEGLGIWVVSFFNRVAYGPQLSTLTLSPHEFSGNILGIGSDGFKVIVCGQNGMLETSTDGESWAPLESGVTTDIYDIIAIGTGVGGTDIPDAPGYVVDENGEVQGPGYEGEICDTNLAAIVTKACELCQIPASEIDVSELNVPVRGYTIASPISGRGGIDPLTRTFFFDCPEFDSKIRFHKRGQALIDIEVDSDSMIDIDDPEDEDTIRGQQVEFPRRHHLKYIAFDQDYVFTDAPAERKSPDVRVVGETSVEAPLVLTSDEAAKTADIQLKVLWTEREDTRKFALPLEYLGIVGGTLLEVDGRRFRADEYRYEDGAIYVERAAYDRASAYTSNATGAIGHRATPPPSTLIGPTFGVLMNLPALRVDDDKLGLYVAGTGVLDGWFGYSVETSLDPANGYDIRLGAVQSRATLGVLTAVLPAAERDYTDESNVLSVRMRNGELNSITDTQFHSGGNAAAILYDDGTAEIVQFRDAVETSEGNYDLTMLNRGRLDTVITDHPSGATFVLLNNALRFVELPASYQGQTITYRLASLGTVRADNGSALITVGEYESQREWSVTNLAAGRDGSDNVTVTWDGRPALGTNIQPQHHAAFVGYQVEYDDGTTAVTKMVARTPLVIVDGIVQIDEITEHQYTAAQQIADFGSVPGSLEVRVSAVNTYTGAGPSTEITV